MRSVSKKQQKGNQLKLERKTINKHEILVLDTEVCFACGLCVDACPKNAMDYRAPITKDGQLLRKAQVNIDKEKCIFCGVCVSVCPNQAAYLESDRNKTPPLHKAGLFPHTLKEIAADETQCDISCGLKCQEQCPTKAIRIVTENQSEGTEKILSLEIKKELCLYCGKCEAACPLNVIEVTKPFTGNLRIKTKLCPKDCKICVDVCPSKAIEIDEEGKPKELPEFCIYCTACEKACPEHAISVNITSIRHSAETSGLWLAVLEKLTSKETLSKELAVVAERKRKNVVRERLD